MNGLRHSQTAYTVNFTTTRKLGEALRIERWGKCWKDKMAEHQQKHHFYSQINHAHECRVCTKPVPRMKPLPLDTTPT